MSKLFKLKEWLTIPDAAKYLSVTFGEEVTEADVLHLALDGHLKLSVNFVNIKRAQLGKIVNWNETDWFCAPPLNATNKKHPEFSISDEVNPEKFKIYPLKLQELWEKFSDDERKKLIFFLRSVVIDNERFLNLSEEIIYIDGVWDLPLFGCERLDVKHRYQMLTNGHDVTDVNLDGVYVEEPNSLKMCQLQDDETGYPLSTLPHDSVLVVRTAALRELEDSVKETTEKPLSTNERRTLLTIIAALCDKSSIEYSGRGSAARISRLTEELGVPVSDDAIRDALKKIPDALEAKAK